MSAKASREDNKIATMIAEECIAVRVRILNRAISSIYDEVFRPLQATVAQVNILVAILLSSRLAFALMVTALRLIVVSTTIPSVNAIRVVYCAARCEVTPFSPPSPD